jgi:hypothetical protein
MHSTWPGGMRRGEGRGMHVQPVQCASPLGTPLPPPPLPQAKVTPPPGTKEGGDLRVKKYRGPPELVQHFRL